MVLLLAQAGCRDAVFGEVRMASLHQGIAYELRSVVALQGRECVPVTGYLSIAGEEHPAETACARDGDLVALSVARDGYVLEGLVDVTEEQWVGGPLDVWVPPEP